MSRFYEALKEASRAHESATNGSAGVLEPGSGIGGIHVPPAPNDAPARQATAAAAVLAENPWLISQKQESPASVSIPQDGGLAAPDKDVLSQKALISNAVDPLVLEQYRRLRTKIIQQHAIKPFRSLIVTSPNPGEGKSVTVLNLALSFAMLSSFKVLVVDGDIRRGSLGRWLGVSHHPGLSNLLDGSAKLEDALLKRDEFPIHFVVSGTSNLAPAELLQSSQLGEQLRRMASQFDLIVVDSPPVNIITDTQLLAASCDAVLLVARAFSTTRKSLEKAAQDLHPFRVIGTILNGGTRAQSYRRYKGYY